MTWDKVVKTVSAALGAIAGAFGGWDLLLEVLTAMMVVDYISGVCVALLGRSDKSDFGGLSSKAGFRGVAKKGLMLLVVLVSALLDKAMGSNASVCRDAVCWFYIANEGLSLLENMNAAGVPFPKQIQKMLGEKKTQSDGEEAAP